MFIIILIIFPIAFLLSLTIYSKYTYGINKCSKHLVGKVVLVTGGSSGIGFETAKDLADRGAKVIIASNDQGPEARDKIISKTGNKNVLYRYLDLASLASVRKFADEFIKTEKQLDILINNAGVLEARNVKTEDALSLGMQINYFGPFLLTNLLLPVLISSAPSRIISVASIAYKYGKIDFENLNFEKESEKSFGVFQSYCNSKLCNVLMTVELARLLYGTGVTANCLHPGLVNTNIAIGLMSCGHRYWLKILYFFKAYSGFLTKSPWQGAQTSIYLAVSPEVSSVSGRYFTECREQNIIKTATDITLTRKLWEVSEELVKLE